MGYEISNNFKGDLKSYYLKEGNLKSRETQIGRDSKVMDCQLYLICRSALFNLYNVFYSFEFESLYAAYTLSFTHIITHCAPESSWIYKT